MDFPSEVFFNLVIEVFETQLSHFTTKSMANLGKFGKKW
jgi:hypothetical protein